MDSVLSPPPPFCFENNLSSVTSGNLSRQWIKWKKSFEIYSKACEFNKKPNEVQVSILLHVIGEQCREVHEQFTETLTTPEALLSKFDKFFLPRKNLTIERHKFFTRDQQEGESVEQYAFELNRLALECDFKDLKDELIKDRLICGLKENVLRERLLREPDLTLKKALDTCRIAEMSRMQAGHIKQEVESQQNLYEITAQENKLNCDADVHWVHRSAQGGAGPSRRHGAHAPPQQLPRARRAAPPPTTREPARTASRRNMHALRNNSKVCDYCGSFHDKFKCPAYGQRCMKCNKSNHFARVCRVYTVAEDSTDQVRFICSVISDKDWSVNLIINDCQIKFKLDTGADVNVLPLRLLSDVGMRQNDLISTRLKLSGYSGDRIRVVGKCLLKLKYRTSVYILSFIIADVASPPILGRAACEELNLIKRIMAVGAIEDNNSSIKILNEYEDVFLGMGCLPGEYKIRLQPNARPVVHAPRKLPIALRDGIKHKLDEMLRQGVIAKVEGPTDWVNSMTVVKKANGDLRICLDPRDLNKVIRREHFKLPTLTEITARLAGAKYFTTLDAKQSFWQIKLNKESTDLCTFNTAFGRYKFLRMPFGISSASEIFHKRLYEQFDDIAGTILFIDDLLVFGESKEIHDKRLRQVLERCRQINIKLNKDKCKVGLCELKYLGHIISEQGIQPDTSHTEAIKEMPKPNNIKDLERFLGLVTYVGSFIPNLSEKTHLLRELLKKDVAWHWEEGHDKCFNNLKKCLTSPPVLRYYSLDRPVTLSVDSSKNGLGACLMQDGMPVCYASRSLTRAEQAYAQIEKELLACVYACEKFYMYIYGRADVTVETDHKPLISIINKPIASAPARLQRMLLRLQPYTFKLVYKPGKYLYVADTLSRAVAPRAPGAVPEEPRDHLDAQAQVCALAISNPLTDSHFVELQKCYSTDAEMQCLKKIIKRGWPVHKSQVVDILRPYWDCRDELTIAYDMVWKGKQIIIPKCMRRDMLKKIHAGHLGAEKCKLRGRETMYWPYMNTQVQDMISHCQACLKFRKENSKQPLLPHEVPPRPWSKVGTDIFHFAGKSFLIIIDYFSKFVEVAELSSLTSMHVVNQLKTIFSRQGIPDIVFSDNGPEFSSGIFRAFSLEWKFKHQTSSPRYPQSNGQAERAVQTIKSMLKKTAYDGSDFRLALLQFLNTPINDKLPSPAEILNSRKLRSPLPCLPALLEPKAQNYKHIKQELKNRQIKQKQYFDRGSKNLQEFTPGSLVKARINGSWIDAKIIGTAGPRSYLIELQTGRVVRRNRRQLIADSPRRRDRPADLLLDHDVAPPEPPAPAAPAPSPPALSSSASVTAHPHDTNYVSRFGRIVRPPDRWGYSAPGVPRRV